MFALSGIRKIELYFIYYPYKLLDFFRKRGTIDAYVKNIDEDK